MKSFNSFTIIELVIVMLLAAILSILIGGTLINLNQYRSLLERRSIPIKGLGRLHYLLERDNFKASDVSMIDDSLVFYQDTLKITYLSSTFGTVRLQGGAIDSFDYLMTRPRPLFGLAASSELLILELMSLDSTSSQELVTISLPRWMSSAQQYKANANEYQ